jgi:hypothetical protein
MCYFLDKPEKIVYNIKENWLLPRDKVSGSETAISARLLKGGA